MGQVQLSVIEQLCRSSIEAGIKRLSEIGTWPRPPAARRLRVGYDFYFNDIQNIQKAQDLVEHLASDDRIIAIYFRGSSSPELHILYDFWVSLLLKILTETEGMSPQNHVFRKYFKRFLSELFSDRAVWRFVDTVSGLTLTEPKLVFDNSTMLTSMPGHRWLDIIWKEQQYYIGHQWGATGLDKASIVTTVTIPKCDHIGSSWPYLHLSKNIERHVSVIDAIRLTKSGAPRIHCHAQFQLSHFPLSDPLAYSDREGVLRLYENEAVLNRGDFKIIKTIWQERMSTRSEDYLPRPNKSDPVGTAYDRFFESYRFKNWFDAIVDLTIALESLFSPKESQELKHRISLRAAWLLDSDKKADNTGNADNKIYNIVRTMYDIRSSRVHGGTPSKKTIHKWVETLSGMAYDPSNEWQMLELALDSARDVVRKAIAACSRLSKLRGDGPKWPFPEDFDGSIVLARQRLVWQKAAGITGITRR